MNAIIRRHRLRQPRSNLATNVLFVVSAAVFALIGNAAIEQQRAVTVVSSSDSAEEKSEVRRGAFVQNLDLHALLPDLLF